MSKFKISGQERRELKKSLHQLKSFKKRFWHYHQLDKDMYELISPENRGNLISDEEAQRRYDKVQMEIEKLTKQLEEKV